MTSRSDAQFSTKAARPPGLTFPAKPEAPQRMDLRISITEDAHRVGWSRVSVRVDAITVMERVVKFGSGEPLFDTGLQSILDLAAAYGGAPRPGDAE